jgi:hypothetical protein
MSIPTQRTYRAIHLDRSLTAPIERGRVMRLVIGVSPLSLSSVVETGGGAGSHR